MLPDLLLSYPTFFVFIIFGLTFYVEMDGQASYFPRCRCLEKTGYKSVDQNTEGCFLYNPKIPKCLTEMLEVRQAFVFAVLKHITHQEYICKKPRLSPWLKHIFLGGRVCVFYLHAFEASLLSTFTRGSRLYIETVLLVF